MPSKHDHSKDHQDSAHDHAVTHSNPESDIIKTDHFSSSRLKLDVETKAKCRISMKVRAEKEFMKDAKNAAIKQIAKEVSIPGFRKGKAPAAIIEKKYQGAVAQGWDKAFADLAFKEAEALAQIPILNGNSKISYQATKLTDDEGEISFQFERDPDVPNIDCELFSLKDLPKEAVDAEKVEETIRSIQMFYAKWDQIKDRAVQEGDFVLLDIDDLDQDPPSQAFSNSRFEVRAKKMATWMRDLVIGKNLGESVDGISMADESESEEVKKEFKPKKVRIHIKGIEEAKLPPIDDELAKKVGVPNAIAMRIQLSNLLLKQSEEHWRKEQREHIADQMIAKVPFEVPGSMLEKEANFRLSSRMRQPAFVKKWKEEMSESEKEAEKTEITKQAEHAIRLFYICRKIIADNKIPLPEDELTPNYDTVLEMMFADPNRVNLKHQSKDQQAMEFSRYMMAKAEDFVIEKLIG